MNTNVHRRVAYHLGFRPELHDPSAWDYRLSRIEQPTYVIVTLADNTVVYGIFGSESYASSVAEERDLYLQQVLAEGFKEVDDVSGMWISASDIKRMEIFWQEDQSGHKRYIFSEYVGRMTKEWVKTLRSLVTRHPGEEESTMTEEEMENGREK